MEYLNNLLIPIGLEKKLKNLLGRYTEIFHLYPIFKS
jgi:hypothetical protein